MQTHRRPDLREPIRALLAKLGASIEGGGDVPLTDLVSAVVGGNLKPDVRARLEARGDVRFVRGPEKEARFSNEGPEARIELKRFAIKIPRRIGGVASFVGGEIALRFDRTETLTASKLLLSVKLQGVALDDAKIVVTMESSLFDQRFDLV